MTSARDRELTQVLQAIHEGDDEARDRLVPLVYEELRDMAGRRMAREAQDHTLQPTALVHEVFMRLSRGDQANWENRAHYFGAAAEAMRRVLIDHARRNQRMKRGGDRNRVPLDLVDPLESVLNTDFLSLNDALEELESRFPRKAEVVKLRYFAGLTISETAAALAVEPGVVTRDWSFARAWLLRRLESGTADS